MLEARTAPEYGGGREEEEQEGEEPEGEEPEGEEGHITTVTFSIFIKALQTKTLLFQKLHLKWFRSSVPNVFRSSAPY